METNSTMKKESNENSIRNTKVIAIIGLMTALTCIMGPLSLPLPFSPVPISLTNLAIYFTIYILGTKRGTISYIIYLLIGFAGLPVFSAFTSGPAKLLGPTGGYLIGFIPMAVIAGLFIEKFPKKVAIHFVGMVLGTIVCYVFGTMWLAHQANMSFSAALAAGVIPFIPGDICKIIIAMIAAPQIKKPLAKAGLI